MYSHRTFWTIAAILFFVATLIVAGNHGSSNRRYAPDKTTRIIHSPEEAYFIWKEKNVRGRTLVLFDSYPHNMGYYSYNSKPQLLQSNLIEYAIFQNIIRRIYFIVPEEEWAQFRTKPFIRPIREATDVTKGLYLYNQSGIPIIAVPPSSLPRLEEEPLVYINTRIFDAARAQTLLSEKRISSDLIISLESPAK